MSRHAGAVSRRHVRVLMHNDSAGATRVQRGYRNMAATEEFKATEDAILDAVEERGSDATAADVILTVSANQPPSVVREAYWQLISDNRLERTADGHLNLIS